MPTESASAPTAAHQAKRHFSKPVASDTDLAACGLRWHRVTPSAPAIPPTAVQGGWTWASVFHHGKTPLFVGRFDLGDGRAVPGKVGGNEFHYSTGEGGKELKATTGFEVLVFEPDKAPPGVKLDWVPHSGVLKDTASTVSGGCRDLEGRALFIARRDHRNGVHVGFVADGSDKCFVSWGGGEVTSSFYDVLVVCNEEPVGAARESTPPPLASATIEPMSRVPSASSAHSSRTGDSAAKFALVAPIFGEAAPASPSRSIAAVGSEQEEEAAPTDVADVEAADASADLLKDIVGLEQDLLEQSDLGDKAAEGADHVAHALAAAIDVDRLPSPATEHAPPLPPPKETAAGTTVEALFPATSKHPQHDLDSASGGSGTRTDPSKLYHDPKVADAVRAARERAVSGALADKSVFAKTGQALSERGDRLQELSLKTEAMQESSKGFLDAIKEYNKREEEKAKRFFF
ncbi:hypothetical protein DFJ74DRAFT_267630 [Hyaloraphidium curvatum]|nr:hypothetical protein DFJ74DRAFT_267630 [Hyaloraphidium curvatum]